MRNDRITASLALLWGLSGLGAAWGAELPPMVVTVAATPEAARSATSIQGQEKLAASIESYLEKYPEWQRAQKAGQQAGRRIGLPASGGWEKDFQKTLEEVSGQQAAVGLRGQALGEEIAKLKNGGGWLASKLRSLSGRVSQADPVTYNEILAALLAEYYRQPERRDAIVALLGAVSERFEKDPRLVGEDPVLGNALDGTMLAFTLIVVRDWRGGFRGLLGDGRAIWSRLRGNSSTSLRTTGQNWAPRESLASATGAGAASEGGATALLRKGAQGVAQSSAAAGVSRQMLKNLRRHGVQMRQSALVGGTAGALVGYDASYEPIRPDPQEALRFIQAQVIVDLERAVAERNAELEKLSREMGELDRKKARERLSIILRGKNAERDGVDPQSLAGIRLQYPHLAEQARSFAGQVRWPELTAKLERLERDALPNPWDYSPEKRLAQAAQSSRDLSTLLREHERGIRQAASARGIAPEEVLYVSLEPLAHRLAAGERLAAALDLALKTK